MATRTHNLVANETANSSSVGVSISAGEFMFAVAGVFDTCTVQLDVKIGSMGFAPVTDAALTAEGAIIIALPDCAVRVTVSSVGASTVVSAAIALLSTNVKDA